MTGIPVPVRSSAGLSGRTYALGMAHTAAAAGYTVDDLDWLRDEVGFAHLELDPWGSLIVTPASDAHEAVMAILVTEAVRRLELPRGSVRGNGFAWTVPGGSGYLMMPDLAILAPGWQRLGELHLDPPPLLVAEVGSPSTRRVDRGRKLADYRLGGAGIYVLVDLPLDAPVTFEAHDFTTGDVTRSEEAIDLEIAGQPLRFDLTDFDQR